ncbi:MAG: hypothetical protein ACI97A_003948, partial [Planctomycetota bacterium]
ERWRPASILHSWFSQESGVTTPKVPRSKLEEEDTGGTPALPGLLATTFGFPREDAGGTKGMISDADVRLCIGPQNRAKVEDKTLRSRLRIGVGYLQLSQSPTPTLQIRPFVSINPTFISISANWLSFLGLRTKSKHASMNEG